jgi:glycosyltransferase involved in cell wall biosynthesis
MSQGFRNRPGNPKVAIVHPRLGFGGSEKRVFWGVEALKRDYDLTIISSNRLDLEIINKFYGTTLRTGDFNMRQVPLPKWLALAHAAAALRGLLVERYCREIVSEYEVLISAYGPVDFGVPAIHFIADFSWCPAVRNRLHPDPLGPLYAWHLPKKIYSWLVDKFDRPTGRNLFGGADYIISVSNWVAAIMAERFKVPPRVIHSPVAGNYPKVPILEREMGFVCLGRISPEKRIEDVLDILSRVRGSGAPVHCHIVGSIGHDAYGKKIKKLIARNASWVEAGGLLSGTDKVDCLARHRFGIHACRGDAFPNSVVEMTKAGCIPFANEEGGAKEIINHDSLLFRSKDEAVEKIIRIVSDCTGQMELQELMIRQSNRYSFESFADELRSLVKEFLERAPNETDVRAD